MAYEAIDLGRFVFPVTTNSAEAQRAFNKGIVWCYGYHHAAAVTCFQECLVHDPSCALALWGIAYASGPNYNKSWAAFLDGERADALQVAFDAAVKANALVAAPGASSYTSAEQALIKAIQLRFQAPNKASDLDILAQWNVEFADAMAEVAPAHAADLNVQTVAAEALMNLTPWALWDLKAGTPCPAPARTDRVVALLTAAEALDERVAREKALANKAAIEKTSVEIPVAEVAAYRHPGILHLIVHAFEMSPHPERALRAADALRVVAPDSGHLRHMPSHIDVLIGDWGSAIEANRRAIIADRKILSIDGPSNFYTLYRSHNYHFLVYSAMMTGQLQTALDACAELTATVPEALLREETPCPMADWLESFISLRYHVLIRFGRWQAVLDEPLPTDPTLYCYTTALLHYAKGIAYASTEDVAAAEAEQARFTAAAEKVPASRTLMNNTCVDILAVAAKMLEGEIAYRRGTDYDGAFACLRAAIALEDSLPYDEPWGWMQPVRHALGALLLEQGRVDEALVAYEEDLGLRSDVPRSSWHPSNVWALHGYVECVSKAQPAGGTGRVAWAQMALDNATARADVPVGCSCMCRLSAVQ